MITPNLIALVDAIGQLPWEPSEYGHNQEIKVSIARLAPEDGQPRNYRHEHEEREDTAGGQTAIIRSSKWSQEDTKVLFSHYGPDISYGELRDYERAAKGMAKVAKAFDSIYATRGPSVDACDSLSRWLEACKVKEVWMRPHGEKSDGWLNKGDWHHETTGSFISRIRHLMPKKPETVAASQEA